MKRFMLALAALALFLTTASLPSMADGNPWPHPTVGSPECPPQGCPSMY